MDEIRDPGLWLEEPLSDEESSDVVKVIYALNTADKDSDPDKVLDSIIPYSNSFMHFAFLLAKESIDIEAVEDGVRYKSEPELYFDLVKFTAHIINERLRGLSAPLVEEPEKLPSIVARELQKIDFPLDKVNANVWKMLENTEGQLKFKLHVDTSSKKSKKEIERLYVIYSLDFSQLEDVSITKKLNPYDKRVYLSISALYNAGYSYMSIQQIYNGMGYKGRAGASDLQKLNQSITKMNGAVIVIDNEAEAKKYKYNHFRYDGSLLPMERLSTVVNNQVAETAIHVFREPPMVTFAKDRKQITTLERKILETPLSKTNANIELEDYILETIAHIKKGQRSRKMLFDTIYANSSISTIKQKQRAPKKIKILLDHYVTHGLIKGYTPSQLDALQKADGVTIKL